MPNEIREIITKAVIGKGHLKNKTVYPLEAITNVSSILGCWIVNHQYHAHLVKEKLYVEGQFDLNIWYSLDDDKTSQVHVETVHYKDELKIMTKEAVGLDGEVMLIATCPQAPVCLEAVINDQGKIVVTCEKTLHVDIVGETKICIEVSSEPEIWDEIDMEVDPTFLEK